MSMQTSGCRETGLIIRKEFIKGFIRGYTELNPQEFEEGTVFEDAMEIVESSLACNEEFVQSSFAGRGGETFHAQLFEEEHYYPLVYFMPIKDGEEFQTVDSELVFVPADKSCFLEDVLQDKSYRTKNEIVSEFKDKLERYLPEDFDWEANIGDIEYASIA